MAQAPAWKQLIDDGRHFISSRTSQTRRMGSELVAQGQQSTSEVVAAVVGLVERIRRRGDDLEATGRAAVARQLDTVDLAATSVIAVAYRLVGGRDQRRSRRSSAD